MVGPQLWILWLGLGLLAPGWAVWPAGLILYPEHGPNAREGCEPGWGWREWSVGGGEVRGEERKRISMSLGGC